jgi:hypothetical protein
MNLNFKIKDIEELNGALSILIDDTLSNNLDDTAPVRTKHEAYGVIAEHQAQIANLAKSLKTNVGSFLTILPLESEYNNTNNALSAIYNSAVTLAKEAIIATVFCRKITDDLQDAFEDERFPLETLAEQEDDSFESAEEITEESEEE